MQAAKTVSLNMGIAPETRKEVATKLAGVLANSYALYVKTQNFHWNVTGALFPQLHSLFEGQYSDLASAVDSLAERIRALGYTAPGGLRAYAELSSIADAQDGMAAKSMVHELVEGHETVVRSARDAIAVAQKAADEASVDLLVERIGIHEKQAWMLRSILED